MSFTLKTMIGLNERRLTSGLVTRTARGLRAADVTDSVETETCRRRANGAPIKDATWQNREGPITGFPRSSPFTDEFIGL